ncbi:unnamed protein product, partial [Scytosiphon promiscuus]
MPTARLAASALPARLRNGPTVTAVAAVSARRATPMRRPRCWSTTATAAAAHSSMAAATLGTRHNANINDGSKLSSSGISSSSSSSSRGTNYGYPEVSLPPTLARRSARGEQHQATPIGPRRALAWAASGVR